MMSRPSVTHSAGFDYDGTRFEVRTPDRTALTWLAEFMSPSFAAHPAVLADYSIELATDAAAYSQLEQQAAVAARTEWECFSNDGYFDRHFGWVDSDGTTWLHLAADEVFVRVPPSGTDVRLVSTGRCTGHRLALMRVIRELATIEQLKLGRLLLHGAAFESAGLGIAVCGPKRTGKTTLLMRSLVGGGGYIANDRLIVKATSSAHIVQGMPTLIRVREGSFEFFPNLVERLQRSNFRRELTIAECSSPSAKVVANDARGNGKLPSLSGRQLAHLLGAPLVRSAPLAKLIFPIIQPEVRGIELVPLTLDESAKLLADSLLAPSHPWRWAGAFQQFSAGHTLSPGLMQTACWRLAREVPAYRCVLGRNSLALELPWTKSCRLAA